MSLAKAEQIELLQAQIRVKEIERCMLLTKISALEQSAITKNATFDSFEDIDTEYVEKWLNVQNIITKLLRDLHNKEVKAEILSNAWKRKKAVDLDPKEVKTQRQELEKDSRLITGYIKMMAKYAKKKPAAPTDEEAEDE